MTDLYKKIKEIVSNIEYLQPGMVIEEKKPFFWRINPDFVKVKSKELEALFKEEMEKKLKEITKWEEEWIKRNGQQVDIGTAIAFSTGLRQTINKQRKKLK